MNNVGAVLVSLALAALIVAWLGKPSITWVSGFITRDRKGRIALVLTPAKKKRKKRRR